MKAIVTLLACALASAATAIAQPSVRAHYAHGQVWVSWNVQEAVLTNCFPTLTPALSNGVPTVVSNCLPATYAIYWSENPVTNTATATLVGRLFEPEWSAAILRDNVNAAFGVRPTGFRIPDGAGGYRTLATNEGLFVHTVRSNFAGHYAVRPFGATSVPAAWRASLTNAVFDLADPPTCHLQAGGMNQNYPVEWWTLWADGDTNLAAARPDFPIMENDRRRGLPHNFSVTSPRVGSLPVANIPACIAFHSGDGQAKMWLPENPGFTSVGLSPVGGLLIAVEDRMFSTKNGVVDAESMTSTGYVPTFDPFFNHQISPTLQSPVSVLPASNEIIIPYPLRRLNWTLDWLYTHKNVDSNRVALVGHSGGAKGSLLWSHASPERFSAVGLYNPALGQFPITDTRYIGTPAQNLPMLLTNHSGQLVRALDIHQYAASYSPQRDLPFTRIFMGKREDNWVTDSNQDGRGDLETAYREIDALALGTATFWDLREHGVDKWAYNELLDAVMNPKNCLPNLTTNVSASWSSNDLWMPSLNSQYRRDDATNQFHHRTDRSYPAIFNCSLRASHGDPGLVIYTNNTVFFDGFSAYDGLVTTTECRPPSSGDKRGTWGGYLDWEPAITDTETNWSGVLFLVGTNSAFNPVEVCPDAARVADIAIRRPQQFKPPTGTLIVWELRNATNNVLFQSGTNIVGPDDLVSIPDLVIPRDPRRARLILATLPAPLGDFGDAPAPYPTTLVQSGALHTSPITLFLGAAVDSETDGQASPNAEGDDNLNTDDEDGVVTPGPLVAGQTATINVTASGAGLLDAFLDTNADGDWTDPGEQILTSQPVVAGVNPLLFPVPVNAVVGQTFARFRLSTTGGLASTGAAANGEVEDYRIVIRAAASSNHYAGLRFTAQGSAQASVSSNNVLLVSNTGAQTNSGVVFDLGQAKGFLALQEATQMESRRFQTLTRVVGPQDGQARPLVSIISKWEGPDFDASKNEVSIETLEIAHEGLTVRHYDAGGRELPGAGNFPGGAASLIYTNDTPPADGVRRSGTITVLDQDLNSIIARPSLRIVLLPPWIKSPRDSASGQATGKVIMPGGQVVEGVAFSVLSYEGLDQPVEALEQVEILGADGTESFAVTEAGLFQDGLRISGGMKTRLGGVLENSRPSLYALPEVDDEVLIAFSQTAIAKASLEELLLSYLFTEVSVPVLDWDNPGSSLGLETVQAFTHPANPGVIQSIGTKYTTFFTDGDHFVFKGEVTGAEAVHHVRIFSQGAEVATLTMDGKGTDVNVEEIELTLTGPGKPIRVRPGIPRAGGNLVETGITFDAPMTISAGAQTFTADEVVMVADFRRCTGPLCDGVWFSQLRLRSPSQTEYRLTPEEPWDWGDLPSPYNTTSAQDGARHRMVRGLRLGRQIDPESNGHPSPTATGDDRFLDDDEDGVIFTSALVPGSNATFNVAVVAPPRGAFLQVDLDWAANFTMTDSGDRILDRQPVVNGINTFTIPVPSHASPGKTYARFRLSFEPDPGPNGPANSGEVEDYVVRILSASPAAHPSGLSVVPSGGANLMTRPDGSLELSDLTAGGDDGVTLFAPSNLVARAAGRILLPLNPPIPLSAFSSSTQPLADGLVLEAHYTDREGNFRGLRLSFANGDATRPVIVGAIFAGHYGEGQFGGRVRVCGFGASGYVGSAVSDSVDLGSFSGHASIIRLGWATFPSSALVIFDGNVTFTGEDGTRLTGNRFRFLLMDDAPGVESASFDFNQLILSIGVGGAAFDLSGLSVRNPMAPMVQTLNLLPNGGATLGFPTEPDTFYSLEATDSLTSPLWISPTTVYQFGTGGAGSLFDPQPGATTRFYRLRME